ncbi:hypothetical protein COLO4_13182 [Corchorus olitorius]|uniref:Peptidyl-prolyl cis-trans isomerase n=1 Tax=Corchorus olitorius TaxID=93759 RepID=A0A1R3JXU3_9ROSI|nr:hypothetical protein COLO4_13182 [Corchorus olitorius]
MIFDRFWRRKGIFLITDDNPMLKHDEPFLLTTATTDGKNTIGSQFYITFKELPNLDGNNIVFGNVLQGTDTIKKIEDVPADGSGKPERLVIITACGSLPETNSEIPFLTQKTEVCVTPETERRTYEETPSS